MTTIGGLTMTILGFLAAGPISQATELRRPSVVAHRGLLAHAPENTLANFRACLALRLGFEFDVRRTRDGELICIHDDTLDRTTDGSGNVSDKTLAEIKRLDAGSWFDPKFAGERTPTVDEVLRLIAEYARHDVLIAVDLKADDVAGDVVRLATKHNVLHRLAFIGTTISDPAVRRQIKLASAKAQTAALANSPEDIPKTLAEPNVDWAYFRFIPTPEQVATIHQAGKRAFLAGPLVSGNLPDNWRKVVNAGADAILTDFPLELLASVRKVDDQ